MEEKRKKGKLPDPYDIIKPQIEEKQHSFRSRSFLIRFCEEEVSPMRSYQKFTLFLINAPGRAERHRALSIRA